MPIYLDRHDTPEEITPEHVAEMHQADLKVQDEFGCRGFTYWFDDKRKSGFCLIEAPNKEALIKMHDHAHGAIPHQIIEVEESMVEAFLGRLADPEKAKNQKLNIIDEPAFRVLLLIKMECNFHKAKPHSQLFKELSTSFNKIISQYSGRVVEHKADRILCSFISTSKAIECAISLTKKGKEKAKEFEAPLFKIGIHCGVPVTDKDGMFEDTITLVNNMCDTIAGEIIISSEVYDLSEMENGQKFIGSPVIDILHPGEQKFMKTLMQFMLSFYRKTDLKVDDLTQNLGLSKSQLYRKLKFLSGKSPNSFIKDYRLKKALDLLEKREFSISEIAFETGFNSPSYFSKCFQKKYSVQPSTLV